MKPPAIVSLIKDIKYAGSMSIVGDIVYAGMDSEGCLWLQIRKDNQEMLEAIVKLLKCVLHNQVKISVYCDALTELVEQYEEARESEETTIERRFREYLADF